MTSRVYVTKNSEYVVDHKTSQGHEVIFLQGNKDRPYAVIGFADPEKLNWVSYGDSRLWNLKDSGRGISSAGELEENLEKTPRPGLRLVGQLVDGEGNFVRGTSFDEVVTSKLKEVRED